MLPSWINVISLKNTLLQSLSCLVKRKMPRSFPGLEWHHEEQGPPCLRWVCMPGGTKLFKNLLIFTDYLSFFCLLSRYFKFFSMSFLHFIYLCYPKTISCSLFFVLNSCFLFHEYIYIYIHNRLKYIYIFILISFRGLQMCCDTSWPFFIETIVYSVMCTDIKYTTWWIFTHI